MKTLTRLVAPLVFIAIIVPSSLLAQEVCFTDANKKFKGWVDQNGKVLNELAEKFKASKEPSKEMVDYNGMNIPIAAALIIEGQKYGKLAEAQLASSVDDAKKCSGQTTIARGVYDLGREWLGLTTVLPEKATRIDFEELRRGNLGGGHNSIINETGRKLDETFNPFRWKF